MTVHQFGGNWTDEKLDCLRKYLGAYRKIFSTNEQARYFITHYVDAFAGTGYRQPSGAHSNSSMPLFEGDNAQDANSYLKGSARIALEVQPPFHRYLFLDTNPLYIQALQQTRSDYPQIAERIQIERAEANTYLHKWCQTKDWSKNRAVVFLDPYGMQVEWSLLEALAKTKAVDLWLLFPLGIGINRLLTKKGEPPAEWAEAITRIFGTDEWRTEFYKPQTAPTLFALDDVSCKNADFETIGAFFIKRLQTIFPAVSPHPLQLCNSRNNPLYLLCFAAANENGAPTALKIANQIIEKKRST